MVGPGQQRLIGGTGRNPITGQPLTVISNTSLGSCNISAKILFLEQDTEKEVKNLGLATPVVWNNQDRLTVAGQYNSLSRGQAATKVRDELEEKGLLFAELEGPDQIIYSKYRDVVSVKLITNIEKKQDPINLRKPVLIVSPCSGEPSIALSCNLNIEACDNKMVCEATGRTGGFCTGCSANETDMHGDQASEYFYLNLGADEVWAHFWELMEQQDQRDIVLDDVVIPSRHGDYRQRLGTKHAPLTDQIEFSKTLSVLHATLLRPYEWVKELVVRSAAHWKQWGKGRLPPVSNFKLPY